MHARERIIRERFAAQQCATCGHTYAAGGVLVLARRRTAWMVLVTCAHCEHRGIFVVSFPAEAHPGRESSPYWQAPQAAWLAEQHTEPQIALKGPVSPSDVVQMREFLTHFDGDFQRLFGDPPRSS